MQQLQASRDPASVLPVLPLTVLYRLCLLLPASHLQCLLPQRLVTMDQACQQLQGPVLHTHIMRPLQHLQQQQQQRQQSLPLTPLLIDRYCATPPTPSAMR